MGHVAGTGCPGCSPAGTPHGLRARSVRTDGAGRAVGVTASHPQGRRSDRLRRYLPPGGPRPPVFTLPSTVYPDSGRPDTHHPVDRCQWGSLRGSRGPLWDRERTLGSWSGVPGTTEGVGGRRFRGEDGRLEVGERRSFLRTGRPGTSLRHGPCTEDLRGCCHRRRDRSPRGRRPGSLRTVSTSYFQTV